MLGKNLIDDNARYFSDKRLQLAFSFQLKYFGMSPWETPSIYSIIPFCEYYYGTYHPIGGLHKIIKAMAHIIEENGGKIHLNTEIKHLEIANKQIQSAILTSGEQISADYFFVNTDFAYTMSQLLSEKEQTINPNVARYKYSASAVMLYLGIDKQYDLTHQSVIFPENFYQNTSEIIQEKILSKDFTIHITNTSTSDNSMAPIGHSSIRIMVPVPNNTSGIDWEKEKAPFRRLILDTIKKRLDIADLEKHIQVEKMITPLEWERDFHIYQGAIFGIQHTLSQITIHKPATQFMKKLKNVFVVGTGAHPGSTLPTIISGAMLAVQSLEEKEQKRNG